MSIQKKVLLVASTIGIVAVSMAGVYYIAVFLPQKQKVSMDLVRLELEAKIEQEKTKNEEENKLKEAQVTIATQQAKIIEQEQMIEKQKSDFQKTSSTISTNSNTVTIKKSCNDSALAKARKRYEDIWDDGSNKYVIVQYENYYNTCLREKGL